MTRDEIDNLFENVKLELDMYYKYSFQYSGELEDYKIQATFGGDSDEIYRVEFSSFENFGCCDNWHHILITKPNDKNFKPLTISEY